MQSRDSTTCNAIMERFTFLSFKVGGFWSFNYQTSALQPPYLHSEIISLLHNVSLISSRSILRQSNFNTRCTPHALAADCFYEVVQGGMVKAVLLNGAGKYYTIFLSCCNLCFQFSDCCYGIR